MTMTGNASRSGVDRSLLTVATDRRQLDVRVPFDVPVIELMPEFQDLLLDETERDRAHFWTLTTRMGRPLDMTRTLADIGVLEGDSLRLVVPSANGAPPVLSDVVEEVSATTGWRWSRASRRATLLYVAAIWLVSLAIGAALIAPGGSRPVGIMCLIVAGAFTLGSVILSRARIDTSAAGIIGLATLPLWAVAGANFSRFTVRDAPLEVAGTAMAVVLLALVAQFLGVPRITTVVAGAALFVVVVELAVVITHVAGGGQLPAAAAATAVFAFVLSYLPRMAAHLSGLTSVSRPELGPESSVRIHGDDTDAIDTSPDPAMVAAKVDQARKILLSLQCGTLFGLICGWAVLATGDSWARWLIPVSALVPVLRSRRHHQVGEIVTLLATGAVGVVASLAGFVNSPVDTRTNLFTAGIVIGVLAAIALYVAMVDVKKVELNTVTLARSADKLEIVVRVVLLPLALCATGAFSGFLDYMTRVGSNFHL